MDDGATQLLERTYAVRRVARQNSASGELCLCPSHMALELALKICIVFFSEAA
jgi:hypothetical protein